MNHVSDPMSLPDEHAEVLVRLDALAAVTADYTERRLVLESLMNDDRPPAFMAQPYALLSAEEEVELADYIAAGKAAAGGTDPASVRAVRFGTLARERFVLANVRLVVSIVRTTHREGLPFDDCVQAGLMGVMRAADKFDPSFGTKFSTYATWWIRQHVQRSIADTARVVRLPVHVHEDLRPVRAARRVLRESLGRVPTLVEVSDATDRPVARVEQVLAFDRDVIDLDTAVEITGDDVRWGHRPDVDVEESLDRERLCERALALLTDREAAVLRRRCGYDTGREETLEEIGQSFGVTRERIRQIEAKAKRKVVEALTGQVG
jgi:RNA polymerase primary sigma factor